MLTLILAAAVSCQVYEPDFYMMMAQENFVMDSLPKPAGYTKYIPVELAEQIAMWDDDCARCRKRANEAVVAMGPDAIRFLFWPLRAKNLRISMHSEAVINKLIACSKCGGSGSCEKFQPRDSNAEQCDVCGFYIVTHEYQVGECMHCRGRGVFATWINLYNGGYQ